MRSTIWRDDFDGSVDHFDGGPIVNGVRRTIVRDALYSKGNDCSPDSQRSILKLKLGEITGDRGAIDLSITALKDRLESQLSELNDA